MADLKRDPLNKMSGKRPVIIVQNNQGNISSGSVIAIVCTSSHKKWLPTHVSLDERVGLRKPSIALCEHIITIDKRLLLNRMGTVVNTDAESRIDAALAISLDL